MRKFRMALVGCGRIAREWLESLEQVEDVLDMVAVVDIVPERAYDYQERFGIKKAYTSVEEALQDEEIEGLLLALPHHLHHEYTLKCVAAGKHVLVEKIMSLSYRQSVEMVEAANKAGVTLMSGQTQRFAGAHKIAKEMIDRGDIGELFNVNAVFRSCLHEPQTPWWCENRYVGDGFIVPMKGSHSVDIFTWIMNGKIPVRVYGQARRMNEKWEGWDEAVYTLTYDNGVVITEHMTYNTDSPENQECARTFSGTKGMIATERWGNWLNINGESEMVCKNPYNSLEFYAGALREFAQSILEGREPMASGREVAPVNAILEAIVESAKTNLPVDMREKYPELF